MTETEKLILSGATCPAWARFVPRFVLWGVLAFPALQRHEIKLSSLLIQMNFVPGEAGVELPDSQQGDFFSLYLLADAMPLSLCPVCVFQSAEFFEDAGENAGEHPQCGVGVGCGARPGWWECHSDLRTQHRRSPRANPGPWREGREREHSSERPGPPEATSTYEQHLRILEWLLPGEKDGEKINRTCQQGRRM